MSSKTPRLKPSINELRDWSGEHLMYELGLLKLCVQLERQVKYRKDRAPVTELKNEYYTIEMALLESLVLHTRTLYEFFFERIPTNKHYYTDARAADFLTMKSLGMQSVIHLKFNLTQ